MKSVSNCFLLASLLMLGTCEAQGPSPAPTPSACEGLSAFTLRDITITSARLVGPGEFVPPAGPGGGPRGPGGGRSGRPGAPPDAPGATVKALPAFCRVTGVGSPHINFEVWLPAPTGPGAWNGKFNGVGNGGLAGFIAYPAMMQALARGYATASTDTGHTNRPEDQDWPMRDPALITDFASRGIHVTAVAAKRLVETYYGRPPARSYFTGCSGGGGQALSEAQRHPADYDGIVAGAPANYPTQMWPGEMYSAYVTHRTPAHLLPREKLPIITSAALAACDAKDGVKDGVLDDPRQCHFNPAVLACKGADAPDCLTAAQVDSVKKIYEGLKDPSSGARFWPGFEISSELGWPGHILDAGGPPLSYFKYMVLRDPRWDWKTFDFGDPKSFAVLVDASRRLGPVLDSIDPDLTPFKQRGGKLIAYHGWLDQNISPRNTIAYYERVKERMGGERDTQSFFRLFMVPGMGHCGGGPGTSTFDALAALEQWVEQGTAPNRIAASRVADGKVDRTRPLCVYPMVAVYRRSGSTDEAANFECRVP